MPLVADSGRKPPIASIKTPDFLTDARTSAVEPTQKGLVESENFLINSSKKLLSKYRMQQNTKSSFNSIVNDEVRPNNLVESAEIIIGGK